VVRLASFLANGSGMKGCYHPAATFVPHISASTLPLALELSQGELIL